MKPTAVYDIVNNKESLLKIAEFLKSLGEEVFPEDISCGICTVLRVEFSQINNVDLLVNIFSPSWPEFSGHRTFPVPSTEVCLSPSDLYFASRNLWIGEYGDLRRELCIHLSEAINDYVKDAF